MAVAHRLRFVKPLDFAALTLAVGLTAAAALHAYQGRTQSVRLEIRTPEQTWMYSMDRDRVVRVPGPLGETVVRIADREVRVVHSPCPNKLCLKRGGISSAGEWNVCLPNQVMIRIEGKKNEEIDAHSH